MRATDPPQMQCLFTATLLFFLALLNVKHLTMSPSPNAMKHSNTHISHIHSPSMTWRRAQPKLQILIGLLGRHISGFRILTRTSCFRSSGPHKSLLCLTDGRGPM